MLVQWAHLLAHIGKKHDVTMIDYFGKIVDHIKDNGISIIKQDDSSIHYKPKAYLSGTCSNSCDLLIIFVKDITTDNALKENKNIIFKDTIVLTLQNGTGNDEIIKNMLLRKIFYLEQLNTTLIL